MKFRNKLNDINHYMKQRNINTDLQIQIRRYVEYTHEEEKYGYQRGETLFKSLTTNLKEEIGKDAYNKIISLTTIFQNNFTEKFLKELPKVIEEKNFAPGEVIFNKSFEKRGIYIIIKGEVKGFIENSNNMKFEPAIFEFKVLLIKNIFL